MQAFLETPATRWDRLVAVLQDVDPSLSINALHFIERMKKMHLTDVDLFYYFTVCYQNSHSKMLGRVLSLHIFLQSWIEWFRKLHTSLCAYQRESGHCFRYPSVRRGVPTHQSEVLQRELRERCSSLRPATRPEFLAEGVHTLLDFDYTKRWTHCAKKKDRHRAASSSSITDVSLSLSTGSPVEVSVSVSWGSKAATHPPSQVGISNATLRPSQLQRHRLATGSGEADLATSGSALESPDTPDTPEKSGVEKTVLHALLYGDGAESIFEVLRDGEFLCQLVVDLLVLKEELVTSPLQREATASTVSTSASTLSVVDGKARANATAVDGCPSTRGCSSSPHIAYLEQFPPLEQKKSSEWMGGSDASTSGNSSCRRAEPVHASSAIRRNRLASGRPAFGVMNTHDRAEFFLKALNELCETFLDSKQRFPCFMDPTIFNPSNGSVLKNKDELDGLHHLHWLAMALFQLIGDEKIVPQPASVSRIFLNDPSLEKSSMAEDDDMAFRVGTTLSCLPHDIHLSVLFHSNKLICRNVKVNTPALSYYCAIVQDEVYAYFSEFKVFLPVPVVLKWLLEQWDGILWSFGTGASLRQQLKELQLVPLEGARENSFVWDNHSWCPVSETTGDKTRSTTSNSSASAPKVEPSSHSSPMESHRWAAGAAAAPSPYQEGPLLEEEDSRAAAIAKLRADTPTSPAEGDTTFDLTVHPPSPQNSEMLLKTGEAIVDKSPVISVCSLSRRHPTVSGPGRGPVAGDERHSPSSSDAPLPAGVGEGEGKGPSEPRPLGDSVGEESQRPAAGKPKSMQFHGSTTRRADFLATVVSESQNTGIEVKPHQFRIHGDLIGKGAFGAVFKALDLETGAFVAVKQSRYTVNQDRDQLNWQEFELWSMLPPHHNVVSFHGASIDETTHQIMLVLEYASGGSIVSLYRDFSPIPSSLFLNHARDIALGLNHLHDHRVRHGDVKPENVLMRSDGTVAISDFGCSRLQLNTGTAGKASGPLAGTVAYMAPEVCVSKPELVSDVWAYACTLLHLWTGEIPWTRSFANFDARESVALLFHICWTETAIPYTREQIAETPTWLQKVVSRALERDPVKRCSIREVLSVLAEWE